MSTSAAVLAEKLRGELLDGTLSAGARLKEEELAERFAVGRYTARSALRTLVSAGLLELEANRGVRVPVLRLARVDELYAYRAILEVGGLSAGLSRHQPLTDIEEATAALADLPAGAPWPVVIGMHQEIHRAIVRWSGNARLLHAYDLCEQEIQFVVAATRPDYTAQRLAALHTDLFTQLRLGGNRAATALARDIETGRRAAHDALRMEQPVSAITRA